MISLMVFLDEMYRDLDPYMGADERMDGLIYIYEELKAGRTAEILQSAMEYLDDLDCGDDEEIAKYREELQEYM